MNVQEYEHYISVARGIILENLDLVEIVFQELKNTKNILIKNKMSKSFLQLLLLIAHTQEGKILFIETLEYVKTYNTELAMKFWDIFDDIENIVKNKHFNIILNPS